jgi:hypothetical protein
MSWILLNQCDDMETVGNADPAAALGGNVADVTWEGVELV